MDEEHYGVIHGDFHGGNLFCQKDKLTAFDFDNIQKCWFLTDLGAILFTVQFWIMGDNPTFK